MKTGAVSLVVASSVFFIFSSFAGVLYVDLNSTNPIPPYADWSTAATNIQDAIDASANGDLILVTNGLYAAGGKSMDGVITNRVSLDKAITVQSVNGPDKTIIQGAWDPMTTNGPGAVRCAWLTNGATLSGFTLRAGATRAATTNPPSSQIDGGGVFGGGTNSPPIQFGRFLGPSTNTIVTNCLIEGNAASDRGGGAFNVTLIDCTLQENGTFHSTPGGTGTGDGGGAYGCDLMNCVITRNTAFGNGGGTAGPYTRGRNCAITQCRAIYYGSGIYQGTAVNCTVTGNAAGGYGSQSGAAANASLTNCIVYGNSTASPGAYTNYYSCSFSFCDTDPLPPGVGNLDVDPQLFADGVHLTRTSPCIGAGAVSAVFGTDIDGQPWNNPPSIGCDEWHPAPVIAIQPALQVDSPAYGLTFSVLAAGQPPFSYFWSQNGAPIQDDGHHINSGTANLIVNHFGPDDAGLYQVVLSNAFGMATSQVAQVVIHAVDAAGANPVPPYSTWASAATTIQDAIDIASAGDIVLVTNGTYATGGKVMMGNSTNRVVLDKALAVVSVNGYSATTIQGAWDPVSTNGPDAIRCAWLTNGAVLSGFTLENGATGSGNDIGSSSDSGGGVWCASTNACVSNCELTNNSAIYGAGGCSGTINNCFVTGNTAFQYGGGALYSTLNNCTVVANYCNSYGGIDGSGAGAFDCVAQNSILVGNLSLDPSQLFYGVTDNYGYDANYGHPNVQFCCAYPLFSGAGNIDADPQFLGSFHIASTSPCHGAGSALDASGTDLDGEAWANPPSIGCDEVVLSNLTGSLSVNIEIPPYQTNVLVNRLATFSGTIAGRATYVTWSFGDGLTFTNFGAGSSHQWTNAGNFTITFTAYNNDHPEGVSTDTNFSVLPLIVPQLESPVLGSNGFEFQFPGQWNVDYTIQYATNLAPPVTWQTLETIPFNSENVIHVSDSAPTNAARFYRVLAQ